MADPAGFDKTALAFVQHGAILRETTQDAYGFAATAQPPACV
jgi:hypothetical protein